MNGRARDFVDYTGGDGGFLEAAIFIAIVFGVLFAVGYVSNWLNDRELRSRDDDE